MSGPFGSSQWMYNPSAGFYGTEIDNSLRFNYGDSAYLSRTPASNGNRKTWTFSTWVKRGNTNTNYSFWGATSGSNEHVLRFNDGTGDELAFWEWTGGSFNFLLKTNAKYRDVAGWYHIVIACDTTQATASDRLKMYVNGEQVTSFISETYPSQNYDTYVNSTSNSNYVGWSGYSTNYYDGYMAETILVDGTALDPTSFGETKSGIWIPKAYSGSYGTNGFHLEFAGNANDTSGNGNNFTANNISAYDYVPDSPTNNFATFSPLGQIRNGTSFFGKGTLSEGNLLTTINSDNENSLIPFAPASGKWYVEFCSKNLAQRQTITAFGNDGFNVASTYVATRSDGGENATGDQSWTTGDIIGVAYDFDNGKVWFAKNNTWYNSSNPATNTGGDAMSALYGFSVHQVSGSTGSATTVFNAGQDSSFAGTKTAQGNTDANGVGDFYYSPPSGYLALCTANLPAPAIDPLDDASPTDYFNTVLYTGANPNAAQSITGVGFQPDFLWIKSRVTGYGHALQDVVRGATGRLQSDTTGAESVSSTYVSSFDSDGFSLGVDYGQNAPSEPYAAWNWKAGGTGVSNTDGSITSTVSANTDAGFSIVGYTGNGTNGATIGHGLGVTPDMIILKNRNSTAYNDNWTVRHIDVGDVTSGTGANFKLNTTDAASNNPDKGWPEITNSSVLTLVNGGVDITNCNENGDNYIVYCFANKDGYLKAGSYVGNGSSDGPFVYTGFRPAWLMVKASSSTGGWTIFNSDNSNFNLVDSDLTAEDSRAEVTGSTRGMDWLSNGFKLRSSFGSRNGSGVTYIYLAFAENPFKYANAR